MERAGHDGGHGEVGRALAVDGVHELACAGGDVSRRLNKVVCVDSHGLGQCLERVAAHIVLVSKTVGCVVEVIVLLGLLRAYEPQVVFGLLGKLALELVDEVVVGIGGTVVDAALALRAYDHAVVEQVSRDVLAGVVHGIAQEEATVLRAHRHGSQRHGHNEAVASRGRPRAA